MLCVRFFPSVLKNYDLAIFFRNDDGFNGLFSLNGRIFHRCYIVFSNKFFGLFRMFESEWKTINMINSIGFTCNFFFFQLVPCCLFEIGCSTMQYIWISSRSWIINSINVNTKTKGNNPHTFTSKRKIDSFWEKREN